MYYDRHGERKGTMVGVSVYVRTCINKVSKRTYLDSLSSKTCIFYVFEASLPVKTGLYHDVT